MSYVEGFVIPVAVGNKDRYLRMATDVSAILVEHGATRVVECWGDDLPEGKVTDFRRAVAAEGEDGVVFSWIAWPSRAVRDAAWPKIMADSRMQPGPDGLPFDGRRLIHGGFEVILDVEA